MRPERTFCVGSHPCQGYRRTSCNGWDWVLLSTGSLKFRQWEPDGANGELLYYLKQFDSPARITLLPMRPLPDEHHDSQACNDAYSCAIVRTPVERIYL